MEEPRYLPRAHTCDDINDLFRSYNFNGILAQPALDNAYRMERYRRTKEGTAPVWASMTLFSGYNLSRFGQLSGPGKVFAPIGFALGLYSTFKSL